MEQLERAHTFTINNRIQAERLRENVNKLRVGGVHTVILIITKTSNLIHPLRDDLPFQPFACRI